MGKSVKNWKGPKNDNNRGIHIFSYYKKIHFIHSEVKYVTTDSDPRSDYPVLVPFQGFAVRFTNETNVIYKADKKGLSRIVFKPGRGERDLPRGRKTLRTRMTQLPRVPGQAATGV